MAANKGQANQSITLQNNYWSSYLNFSKEISSKELFQLQATLNSESHNVVIPIDPANTSYPLVFNFNYGSGTDNYSINAYYLNENSTGYYGFKSTSGETVYFDYPYYSGSFYKIVDQLGNVSTTSTTYGNLKLYTDANNHFYFKDKNGVNLSKTVLMSADTYTITNYVYDDATSNLSFNFTLNFGGYPYSNSTTHPLTVSGTFTGKAYDKITNSIIKADDGFTH